MNKPWVKKNRPLQRGRTNRSAAAAGWSPHSTLQKELFSLVITSSLRSASVASAALFGGAISGNVSWSCTGEDRDVFSTANVAQCGDCLCGCSVGREGDYRLKVRRRVLSQPPSSTPADYTRDPPWAARRNVLWAAAELPAWCLDTLLTGMEDPDWREGGTVKYKCKYKYK